LRFAGFDADEGEEGGIMGWKGGSRGGDQKSRLPAEESKNDGSPVFPLGKFRAELLAVFVGLRLVALGIECFDEF
jgi:hypothetical protein